MTYCDGENDDREVDPDGDNKRKLPRVGSRLWHSTDYGTLALMAQQDYGTLALAQQDDML